ncbi:uncharacterized protein LY89DRAFT_665110 [Mollisia scopiformis]|uniref:2EXR domain-containing protein n=1 Tax=Mollisia scopiformis TaxID=149040 RepID=A0A194XPY4_MOLSC|nr:uncharacterized protein LY89DRAFT_665110 [Mollisia scopiformis]KUJ22221.1 hypothetical protein LY89DRAFT_665110 [Mollisia scopiformis]
MTLKTYGKSKKKERDPVAFFPHSSFAEALTSAGEALSSKPAMREKKPASVNKNSPTSPSTATVPPAPSNVSTGVSKRVILTNFHVFLDFPIEIQILIWRAAIQAIQNRIIIWRSPVVPPLLHACARSRELFLEDHRVERWLTSVFGSETLFINWEHDIVYFEGRVPGMQEWDIAPLRDDRPVQQLYSWVPHFASSPQTGGKWLEEIRFMALSVNMVKWFFAPQRVSGEIGWEVLHRMCPKLKILYVICGRRELNNRDTLRSLSRIRTLNAVNTAWSFWDIKNSRAAFNAAKRMGVLTEVELRFMDVRDTNEQLKEHVVVVKKQKDGQAKQER